MQKLAKRWKLILSILLILLSVMVVKNVYMPKKAAFESERDLLQNTITALETNIATNMPYIDVREELPEKSEEIQESRNQLYKSFPVELKEEDQILYVLHLEQVFGNEISFEFAQPEQIVALNDGSILNGQTISVNYKATYERFKELVKYLSTDSRVASVQYATMEYDAEQNLATGEITITLYSLTNDSLIYDSPSISVGNIGKDNLFD